MADPADTSTDGDQPDKPAKPGETPAFTRASVLRDFRRAYEAKEQYLEEALDDALFALGDQWEAKDVQKLKRNGAAAMTINNLAPMINLLKGIESQNRTDLRAFAEGKEDSLEADVVTRCLKHMTKVGDLDYKFSEVFSAAATTGLAELEPFVDYPTKVDAQGNVDLMGRLQFRVRHFNSSFPDPVALEFDDSDGEHKFKVTRKLTKEQLVSIFPDKADEIGAIKDGEIKIDDISLDVEGIPGVQLQTKGYNDDDENAASWIPKKGYDLLDCYYKKRVQKWYVADASVGKAAQFPDEASAKAYVAQATKREPAGKETAQILTRFTVEIWVAFLTGGMDDFLYNGPAWSFPRWESFPLFSCYAYKTTYPLDATDRHWNLQGIVRGAKDSQRELNRRRTQEMRHLNQSSNSGWIVEDESMSEKQFKGLEDEGAKPGIVVRFKKGSTPPSRITPVPLSQGHAQMAQEHRQDLQTTVGINTETLSVENDQSSGRAIGLRIKQGLVQVQGLFDNYSRFRRQVGRFMIAMLSEVFDITKIKRVLGDAFLQENFQSPVMAPVIDPRTQQPAAGPDGKPMMAPRIDPQTGQPQMQYDDKLATQFLTKVIQDSDLGVYDIEIGEIVAAATSSYGQFQEALDLQRQGIPIPPQVLVDGSSLSSSAKKQTVTALAQQAQMAAAGAPGPGKQPPKKAA